MSMCLPKSPGVIELRTSADGHPNHYIGMRPDADETPLPRTFSDVS